MSLSTSFTSCSPPLKEFANNYILKVHYEVGNKVANLPSFEYVARRLSTMKRVKLGLLLKTEKKEERWRAVVSG